LTYHGHVSALPWCVECKRRLVRKSAKEQKNDRKVDAFLPGGSRRVELIAG